jgi:AI-2 transport protein TqsA
MGNLVGSSINEFSKNIPLYSKKINEQYIIVLDWLEQRGVDTSKLELVEVFDPGKVMQLVAKLFNGLGDVLTNGFLILITVIFMLLEASSFPQKMLAVFRQPEKTMAKINQITNDVKHYLAIKTFISFMTGALVAIFLTVIGLDYPLLWGLFAFLLNYVPNIGSIIASIPAILQAFIQMGLGGAIGVTIGYLAINMIMANLIEPRLMGKSLGLSTLVVFLSLIFWGWVLGPVGMLLSVVLTVTVKIILEGREDTRWLAVLLGSEAPAMAAEQKSGKTE